MLIALVAAIVLVAAALIGLLIRQHRKGHLNGPIAVLLIVAIAAAGFSVFFYPASLTLMQTTTPDSRLPKGH